ncbi:thiolase domain-containing protein [Candidatus Woesearchaeota archaeon]|nr:thiolase domain-containing protein [Candidatus Woesearchaeota archaeon]
MHIKGVGMTKFGISDKHSWQLAYDAALGALKDADMKFTEIDAIVCSSLEWFFSVEKQRHFSSVLSSMFRTHKPIIRIPAACAGGGTALWFANQLEEYDNILVVGAEKLMTCKTEAITDEFMMAAESKWEQLEGLNFPGQNALVAQEYMQKYPETTPEHLAKIAFKNHSNALLNPKARFYGKGISLETIKNSPMVCSPLRLFDCSISVDGAACAIISKDKSDVNIIGSDLCTDYLPTFEREDNTSWDGSVITAKNVYSQASISPKDIDVAELHDAFTSVELIAYEDMGMAERGKAYEKIEDGYFNLDGKIPVNTSGGLKAKGHPVSATGLAQIYELVKQIRNEAGDRQVNNPKLALAHNIGGAGGTVACHILKKTGGINGG